MTKSRIPETDYGIQGQLTVTQYDQMQCSLRDRGWIETPDLLKKGINTGCTLEIGPGPGYLGLEWLKHTVNTTLVGLDISPDMQALAQRNAHVYGLASRTDYRLGNCDQLPFDANTFDAVFTNGSLHEWANPLGAFNEVWRVLKPDGKYYISDLRRDMNFLMYGFLWLGVRPTAMRPGLKTSIDAAYTPRELSEMVANTKLKNSTISTNLLGVTLFGEK